jgi:hypothetical protein
VTIARLALVAAIAAASIGCTKKKIECFEVSVADNSPGTRAVFEARHCQGGGETWGAILHVLAARRGRVDPIEFETPGWTGAVYALAGGSRFSIDGEGDAVRFCADDPGLVGGIRRDVQRVNGAAAELKQAMAGATALELECRELDGTLPKLPNLEPEPELPAETVRATELALARLKVALDRQPVWCFPPDDPEKHSGTLRFTPDGRVTWTATNGKPVGDGRWTSPPAAHGDDRIEVVISGGGGLLRHFDLGKSGRIGLDLIGETITRSEMLPGACPTGVDKR